MKNLINVNTLNTRTIESVIALKNIRKYNSSCKSYSGNTKNSNALNSLLKGNTDIEKEEIKKLLSIDCDKHFSSAVTEFTGYKDNKAVTKQENNSYYPIVVDSPNYKESKEDNFSFYSCVSDSMQVRTATQKIVTPFVNSYNSIERELRNKAMLTEDKNERLEYFTEIGKIYTKKINRKSKIAKFYNIEFVLTTNGTIKKRAPNKAKRVTISKAKVISRAKAKAKRENKSETATKTYIKNMLIKHGYNKK